MAYIPDEAIDSLDELTKGARLYYVWLCRVRNQKTGRCFPSVETTMESLSINRGTVYALRKELQAKGWADFSGNNADLLKGFNSLKNQTVFIETKEDTRESLKNQTFDDESLKNQTDSLKNQTQESEKSDKKSEKSDSPIRNNQQTRTSKENQVPAARKDDPFFERFRLAYEALYDCPYIHQQADFVQLANLRKKDVSEWLTLDRWQVGVDHYFASELGSHTLKDLSSRFGAFFRAALDRYGNPVANGHGSLARSPMTTPKTAGNIAAVEAFIAGGTKGGR